MTDKGFKEKPKSIFDQIPDSFEEFLESKSDSDSEEPSSRPNIGIYKRNEMTKLDTVISDKAEDEQDGLSFDTDSSDITSIESNRHGRDKIRNPPEKENISLQRKEERWLKHESKFLARDSPDEVTHQKKDEVITMREKEGIDSLSPFHAHRNSPIQGKNQFLPDDPSNLLELSFSPFSHPMQSEIHSFDPENGKISETDFIADKAESESVKSVKSEKNDATNSNIDHTNITSQQNNILNVKDEFKIALPKNEFNEANVHPNDQASTTQPTLSIQALKDITERVFNETPTLQITEIKDSPSIHKRVLIPKKPEHNVVNTLSNEFIRKPIIENPSLTTRNSALPKDVFEKANPSPRSTSIRSAALSRANAKFQFNTSDPNWNEKLIDGNGNSSSDNKANVQNSFHSTNHSPPHSSNEMRLKNEALKKALEVKTRKATQLDSALPASVEENVRLRQNQSPESRIEPNIVFEEVNNLSNEVDCKLLQEQERLIRGYEIENQKLFHKIKILETEMKLLQESHRVKVESMNRESLQLHNALTDSSSSRNDDVLKSLGETIESLKKDMDNYKLEAEHHAQKLKEENEEIKRKAEEEIFAEKQEVARLRSLLQEIEHSGGNNFNNNSLIDNDENQWGKSAIDLMDELREARRLERKAQTDREEYEKRDLQSQAQLTSLRKTLADTVEEHTKRSELLEMEIENLENELIKVSKQLKSNRLHKEKGNHNKKDSKMSSSISTENSLSDVAWSTGRPENLSGRGIASESISVSRPPSKLPTPSKIRRNGNLSGFNHLEFDFGQVKYIQALEARIKELEEKLEETQNESENRLQKLNTRFEEIRTGYEKRIKDLSKKIDDIPTENGTHPNSQYTQDNENENLLLLSRIDENQSTLDVLPSKLELLQRANDRLIKQIESIQKLKDAAEAENIARRHEKASLIASYEEKIKNLIDKDDNKSKATTTTPDSTVSHNLIQNLEDEIQNLRQQLQTSESIRSAVDDATIRFLRESQESSNKVSLEHFEQAILLLSDELRNHNKSSLSSSLSKDQVKSKQLEELWRETREECRQWKEKVDGLQRENEVLKLDYQKLKVTLSHPNQRMLEIEGLLKELDRRYERTVKEFNSIITATQHAAFTDKRMNGGKYKREIQR